MLVAIFPICSVKPLARYFLSVISALFGNFSLLELLFFTFFVEKRSSESSESASPNKSSKADFGFVAGSRYYFENT